MKVVLDLNVYDLKESLGSIEPVGETNLDAVRLERTINQSTLISLLVEDLLNMTKYRHRGEYSMKRIGETAYKELKELQLVLNENLKED